MSDRCLRGWCGPDWCSSPRRIAGDVSPRLCLSPSACPREAAWTGVGGDWPQGLSPWAASVRTAWLLQAALADIAAADVVGSDHPSWWCVACCCYCCCPPPGLTRCWRWCPPRACSGSCRKRCRRRYRCRRHYCQPRPAASGWLVWIRNNRSNHFLGDWVLTLTHLCRSLRLLSSSSLCSRDTSAKVTGLGLWWGSQNSGLKRA